MEMIFKPSGGSNMIFRPQAQPRWVPSATTEAAWVDLYWRVINEDDTRGVWQLWGRTRPGADGSIHFNPANDVNAELSAIPINASGIPKFATPDDGIRATVIVRRATDALIIGQNGTSTTETATVGISGLTTFSRKLRVRIATALVGGALDSPTETFFDSTPDTPPPYLELARGTGPQTIYVVVAQSSGGAWTVDSNILMVSFQTAEGTGGAGDPGTGAPTGGTDGDFDPVSRNHLALGE